jgi:hypothetical protein
VPSNGILSDRQVSQGRVRHVARRIRPNATQACIPKRYDANRSGFLYKNFTSQIHRVNLFAPRRAIPPAPAVSLEARGKFGDIWRQSWCVLERYFARCRLRDGKIEHALLPLFMASLRTPAHKNEERPLGFDSHPFRQFPRPPPLRLIGFPRGGYNRQLSVKVSVNRGKPWNSHRIPLNPRIHRHYWLTVLNSSL